MPIWLYAGNPALPTFDLSSDYGGAGNQQVTSLAKKGGHLRDYTPEPAVRAAFPLGQNWKGTWYTILPG